MVKLNKPGSYSCLMLWGKLGKVATAAFAISIHFSLILNLVVCTGGQHPAFLYDQNFNIDEYDFLWSTDYDQVVTDKDGNYTEGRDNQNKIPLGNIENNNMHYDNFNSQREVYSNDRGERELLKSSMHSEERGYVDVRDHLDSNKEQQNFEFWNFDKNHFLSPSNVSLKLETTSSLLNIGNMQENALKEELNFDKSQKESDFIFFDESFDTMFIDHATPTLDKDSEKDKQRYPQYLKDQQGSSFFNLNHYSDNISENNENNTNIENIIFSNISNKQTKRKLDIDSPKVTHNEVVPFRLDFPKPDPQDQPFYFEHSLINNDASFDKVVSLGFKYDHLIKTGEQISFITRESHIVLITPYGLLVSSLKEQNDLQLPGVWDNKSPNKLYTKIKNSKLASVYKAMSSRIKKDAASAEFNDFNKTNLELIWINTLDTGHFSHINRLRDLYSAFIIDNELVTEFVDLGDGAFLDTLLGDRFIVVINSSAADIVRAVGGVKGHSAKSLYSFICSKAETMHLPKQELRLIIIKMKKSEGKETMHTLEFSKPSETTDKDLELISSSKSGKPSKTTGKGPGIGNSLEFGKLDKTTIDKDLEIIKNIPKNPKTQDPIISRNLLPTDNYSKSRFGKNSATLQLDPPKKLFNWSKKFTKVGSTFERAVVSEITHSRQYSTDDELILTINNLPGIMITGNEFFASRRIDYNEGVLSKILEADHLSKSIEGTNKGNFGVSGTMSLESAIKETTERYDFLCRNNILPAIWISYHKSGTIFHTNRLENLYEVYFLHNKKFTKLKDSNNTIGAFKPTSGSNFIIIISNAAATSAVHTPFKLKSDDAEEIYNYLRTKIKVVSDAFRLIVIKLKENLKGTNKQMNRNQTVINLVNDEPIKDIIPGNSSLESISNAFFTRTPPFILELLNSQTGITMGNRPLYPAFLADKASDFVEIMTSKIGYEEMNTTAKSLMFLKKGSPGFIFSCAGFLVSYLVKQNSWPVPKVLNKVCPEEVTVQMGKSLLENNSLILNSRITENHEAVFKTLSYGNNAPIIWAQLLKNGDIVYANGLESLYQIYVLDGGKFVKLDHAKDGVKIYKASSKITFIIMVSSSIANVIDLAPEFGGNDTNQLYMFLWNKIIQGQGQMSAVEPELMVIKMRENSSVESRPFFRFDSGN